MFDLAIKTQRLTLRTYRLSDAPRLRALVDDYEIAKMCGSILHPYPDGEAERWIGLHGARRASGKGYPFAIELDGHLAGSIGIEEDADGEAELGCWFSPKHWNKGLASEASAAVLRFGFGWRALTYVRARFQNDNSASERVLAKAGFLATERYTEFHKVRAHDAQVTKVILTRDAWIET